MSTSVLNWFLIGDLVLCLQMPYHGSVLHCSTASFGTMHPIYLILLPSLIWIVANNKSNQLTKLLFISSQCIITEESHRSQVCKSDFAAVVNKINISNALKIIKGICVLLDGSTWLDYGKAFFLFPTLLWNRVKQLALNNKMYLSCAFSRKDTDCFA